MNVKRAALYIRVSSQGQVRDGYSLAFQEEILREFCQREGHLISGIYRDGGQSGSTTQRKDLTRLIEDARERRFDVVLIFRVDRFSRDPVDLLALVRELEKRSIKLRSVTEAVDASDPAGELMLTILGAIGKFVRQNIIQNAMLGKTKRAEAGRYTGGTVPFGYVTDEGGVYQLDTRLWWNGLTVAEVAKLVFDTYLKMAEEGSGCGAVAKRLNEMGVTPPRKVWATAAIYQMLTNPCYAGDFAWNKRSHNLNKPSMKHTADEWTIARDAHEPIVDRAVWERTQQLLKHNKTYHNRPFNEAGKDLIVGFLKCAECGSALSARRPSNVPHAYYTCLSRYSAKRRREETACADFPYIRGDELENLIWDALVQMAGDHARIEEIRERMNANAAPDLAEAETEIARLAKRLASMEEQAMTLTTQYLQKQLPAYLWQKQLERIEKDREGVKDRMAEAISRVAELKAQMPLNMEAGDVQQYLKKVLAESTTLEERREALTILVGHRGIRVSRDGTVDFEIKIPAHVAAVLSLVESSALTRRAL